MRADRVRPLRRGLAGAALTLPLVVLVQVAGARAAVAFGSSPPAPTPTPTPSDCAFPVPPGGKCPDPTNLIPAAPPLDPLESIANSCAKAASWVIKELAKVVNSTTQVDFTNAGFMRQYAVVFGASTFLTLILWMMAVAKRAVNGVPLGRAVGEAIGYLWLAVLASAFTPVVLALIVRLTDAITDAIATGTRTDTDKFLNGFAASLDPSGFGGGPIMAIFVSILAIFGAAIIWVELLIRAAMLYVGAVLGTAVYAGLVDRDLWHHVRRWAGLMVAIILAKPVIIIVLGLATAVSSGSDPDSFSSVLTGLAILFLAIFASVIIYRFVPNFGDDMSQLHATRRTAANAGPASIVNGPATYMRQGIATHGSRASASRASVGSGPAAAGAVAAGVVTHAGRHAAHAVTSSPQQQRPAPPPPPPPPRPPQPGPVRKNGGSP